MASMLDPGREAGPRLRLAYSAPVYRPALSIALCVLAAAALVPAYLVLAPASTWTPGGLLVALGAVALVSYFGGLIVDRSLVLDAGIVAALAAVVFLGPLPAAVIWIGTELV